MRNGDEIRTHQVKLEADFDKNEGKIYPMVIMCYAGEEVEGTFE